MRRIILLLVAVVGLIALISFAAHPEDSRAAGTFSTYLPVILRGGAPPTPTPPPGTCNSSVQVLANGSFEQPLSTGWVTYGNPVRTDLQKTDGSYSLVLGRYDNADDEVWQDIQVPTWAETGALYISWAVASTDSSTTPYDKLYVAVLDGDTVVAGGTASNADTRSTWYESKVPVSNISALRGRTLTVFLGAINDSNGYPTTFYLDNARFYFACGSSVADLPDSDAPLAPISVLPGLNGKAIQAEQ